MAFVITVIIISVISMQGCKGEIFTFSFVIRIQNKDMTWLILTKMLSCREIKERDWNRQPGRTRVHFKRSKTSSHFYFFKHFNTISWMFAVHGNPYGRATLPTRRPPGFAKRKPLCAAISEIVPEEDATRTTQWVATTKRQWAPLWWDGHRKAEEYGGGEQFHCICCPQPSASSGGCCSAVEAKGGEFGICGNPC